MGGRGRVGVQRSSSSSRLSRIDRWCGEAASTNGRELLHQQPKLLSVVAARGRGSARRQRRGGAAPPAQPRGRRPPCSATGPRLGGGEATAEAILSLRAGTSASFASAPAPTRSGGGGGRPRAACICALWMEGGRPRAAWWRSRPSASSSSASEVTGRAGAGAAHRSSALLLRGQGGATAARDGGSSSEGPGAEEREEGDGRCGSRRLRKRVKNCEGKGERISGEEARRRSMQTRMGPLLEGVQ